MLYRIKKTRQNFQWLNDMKLVFVYKLKSSFLHRILIVSFDSWKLNFSPVIVVFNFMLPR
jgi:hypothetical protein